MLLKPKFWEKRVSATLEFWNLMGPRAPEPALVTPELALVSPEPALVTPEPALVTPSRSPRKIFAAIWKLSLQKIQRSIPGDVKWSQDLRESDESCSGSRKCRFIPDFQFYVKKYFGHKPALEKWSRGATGSEMTGSTRSTTLVLTIFFDFFDPGGPGGR